MAVHPLMKEVRPCSGSNPRRRTRRFTIQVSKSEPKSLAKFRKELQALLKKHKVKQKRKPSR